MNDSGPSKMSRLPDTDRHDWLTAVPTARPAAGAQMTTPSNEAWNEAEWDEAEGQGLLVKWETPGQVIQGIFQGFKEVNLNNNKQYRKYSFEAKDEAGELVVLKFRGTTDLDAKMEQVESGDEVRITFVETKTQGGNTWKEFKVQYRKPIAVQCIPFVLDVMDFERVRDTGEVDDLRAKAIREAAQVVMCMSIGLTFDVEVLHEHGEPAYDPISVLMLSEVEARDKVTVNLSDSINALFRGMALFFKGMALTMAGPYALVRYLGYDRASEPSAFYGDVGTVSKYVAIMKQQGVPEDLISATCRNVARLVKEVVSVEWPSIVMVADALVSREWSGRGREKRMTAAEVQEIVYSRLLRPKEQEVDSR